MSKNRSGHLRQIGTPEVDAAKLVRLAYQRLESHPSFDDHCQTIGIECVEGRLVLTGRLPSFYLRQLAEEAVQGLGRSIDNQIDVVCCDGLSSARLTTKPKPVSTR